MGRTGYELQGLEDLKSLQEKEKVINEKVADKDQEMLLVHTQIEEL